MDPQVQQMISTYEREQARYLASGDARLKPAADTARAAIEKYISDLEGSIDQRRSQFDSLLKTRSTAGGDLDKVIKTAQKVRDDSKTIASDYLVASSYNDPTPIDWSKYHVKFSIVLALIGGIVVVAISSS